MMVALCWDASVPIPEWTVSGPSQWVKGSLFPGTHPPCWMATTSVQANTSGWWFAAHAHVLPAAEGGPAPQARVRWLFPSWCREQRSRSDCCECVLSCPCRCGSWHKACRLLPQTIRGLRPFPHSCGTCPERCISDRESLKGLRLACSLF